MSDGARITIQELVVPAVVRTNLIVEESAQITITKVEMKEQVTQHDDRSNSLDASPVSPAMAMKKHRAIYNRQDPNTKKFVTNHPDEERLQTSSHSNANRQSVNRHSNNGGFFRTSHGTRKNSGIFSKEQNLPLDQNQVNNQAMT
jgi:hypothetical protein